MAKKVKRPQAGPSNQRESLGSESISNYKHVKIIFGQVVNNIQTRNQPSIRPKGKYLKKLYDQLLYIAHLRLILFKNEQETKWRDDSDEILRKIPKNVKFEKFMEFIDKFKPKEAFSSVSQRFLKKNTIRRLTDIRNRHKKMTPAAIADLCMALP